jgi:hypothetical protein
VPETRLKDGVEWPIGGAEDVAWINEAVERGVAVQYAIPPVFAAYFTVALAERKAEPQREHDEAVVKILRAQTSVQPWWLGYLEYGLGIEIVFDDAPKTKLYSGWDYVVAQGGPDQALNWRPNPRPFAWKGALPELIFPADRSWLLSTHWDDEYACVGGPEALAAAFLGDPLLGPRTRRRVAAAEERTPPGPKA